MRLALEEAAEGLQACLLRLETGRNSCNKGCCIITSVGLAKSLEKKNFRIFPTWPPTALVLASLRADPRLMPEATSANCASARTFADDPFCKLPARTSHFAQLQRNWEHVLVEWAGMGKKRFIKREACSSCTAECIIYFEVET